ncbi:MAG: pyridoxal phosphate-dependent aminotransferase [Thermoplasmatales archaeon]|nr:pyridoxal phosphate-dependent aminotransferase [Candidatus Thermoplasmatota archaeon]MDA8054365.1 pyridoxal phosphate-dependent aminotransferase [Thermoplasmatales archaeon]
MEKSLEGQKTARKKGISLSERAVNIDDDVFKLALGLPKDVIPLTAGEPDFPTADFVNLAAKKAMDSNFTHYTASNGILPLREAISKKLKEDNNLSYDPDEIVVSPGSSPSIFLLLFALADRGDEVLVPDPAWFHYPILTSLAGGRAIRVPQRREEGFRLAPEDIERKITDRTRLMIVNSPSNPTGHVLSKEELEGIAGVAERKNLIIISDEIYEKILYGNHKHISIASLSGMRDRTVTVNGLSKGYAMMGWRIGFAASNAELSGKMRSLLGYTVVCPGSVAQYAAIEALTSQKSREYVKNMVATWTRRRIMVLKFVEEFHDVMSIAPPEGAFYGWINVSGSGMTGKDVSANLLKEYKVGVMPGYLFGDSGKDYIRISYATSDEVVEEGMKRLGKFLREHKK